MSKYIKPEIKIDVFDTEELLTNSTVSGNTIDDWHNNNPGAEVATYKESDFTERVKIAF